MSEESAERANARVQAVFDDWAERGRAEGMEAGHGPAARAGFERLELTPGAHYLDVGCGNGYTVRWAAPLVGETGRAVGIDISPRMIERARAASAGQRNLQFHVAAFPAHPLPPGAFRGIFSMEVLYYLPDLRGALDEVARLLEPGGRFACVVDYYRENEASHDWPSQVGCPMRMLSMAGWTVAFEAARLEVVAQRCILHPEVPGEAPGWKQTQGSLLTVGQRPRAS